MIYKISIGIFIGCVLIAAWFVYSEIFRAQAQFADQVAFTIEQGESLGAVAARLEQEQVVRHAWLFRRYLTLKGIDTRIQAGAFIVSSPITLARVAAVLSQSAAQAEKEITILPGWDIRNIAAYVEEQGIGKADDVFGLVGEPARMYDPPYAAVGSERLAPVFETDAGVIKDKPLTISYEGYLAPDTYRIFSNATVQEVLQKLIAHRDSQFTEQLYADIAASGRMVHEIITMASIIEREVRSKEDKEKVADLFWRRYDNGWALQADSTVHYALGKKGDVFTTKEDRDSLSPWNTYRYPGLPPGPISNPSLESILAAIYPKKNEYWYFLTTSEGDVKYGETLEDHNRNVQKYLR